MDYLDSIFSLWLLMLNHLVNDNNLGAVFWVFILVMTLLIVIKTWRGVTAWKHS